MIINKSKKIIIAKKYKLCNTKFSKALGLMFRKKIIPMVFTFDKDQKIGLHMFFVFSEIDVIYLDKNNRVVELKKNFRPFTIFNPKNKARYVIELPINTINELKIDIGDIINF